MHLFCEKIVTHCPSLPTTFAHRLHTFLVNNIIGRCNIWGIRRVGYDFSFEVWQRDAERCHAVELLFRASARFVAVFRAVIGSNASIAEYGHYHVF